MITLFICEPDARWGTIDLFITDVPKLVQMTAVASLGSSDHSSVWVAMTRAQTVQNLSVSRTVFLKHRVNLDG